MRKAAAALLLLAAAAGCAPSRRVAAPVATPASVAAVPSVCRIGADGGPLLVDRGIGGTGAPPVQQADRGIGGTGIIGVITGFASVCLAGREVGLDDSVPVEVEGQAAGAGALRAGQVAAVEADGVGPGLHARRIAVRHEVSGPVQQVSAGGLVVAGQPVALSAQTWMAAMPAVGEWVAVSGLRGWDGVVQATRLDPRPPGPVAVHGVLRAEAGRLLLGMQEVRLPPGAAGLLGQGVTVTGWYRGDALLAGTAVVDLVAEDPVRYFGGRTTAFVLEGYVTAGDGRVRWGRGGTVGPGGRTVLELERGRDGLVRPVATRDPGGRGPGGAGGRAAGPVPAARGYDPAPMPNRALDPAEARGDARGEGRRGAGRGPGGGRAEGSNAGGPNAGTPNVGSPNVGSSGGRGR